MEESATKMDFHLEGLK